MQEFSQDKKKLPAAIDLYQRLLAESNSAPLFRHNVSFELGKLLDKTGKYSEAMSAFENGHSIAIDLLHKNHPELLLSHSAEEWDAPEEGGPSIEWHSGIVPRKSLKPAPIFVIGFPRSGTTLIEQVLAAHPKLDTLDEIVAIDRAIHELQQIGCQYPESLPTLSDSELDRAESGYWHEVSKHHHINDSCRVVDKYPFNLVKLPMIYRLFPDAKIIMMLRHPLDCVLSCYMQKFRLNKGTVMWATLETTAELYRRAIGAYLWHKNKLDINVLEVKYELLVNDFNNTVASILEFIEVPWDSAVLDFNTVASGRGRISTPSYSQVVQPVYAQAIDRWKYYAPYLKNAAKHVEPYISYFDYINLSEN